jgi:hypothetical protein
MPTKSELICQLSNELMSEKKSATFAVSAIQVYSICYSSLQVLQTNKS